MTWFLYLYLWGAYIKKNDIEFLEKKPWLIGIISILCIWISSVVINFIGAYIDSEMIVSQAYYFSTITSPLVIVSGLSIFVAFKNLNINKNKFINHLGSVTFAVYLLHDNPLFKDTLWHNIVKTDAFYNSNIILLIIHMIVVVVAFFLIASVIEFIRIPIENLILNNKIMCKFYKKINSLYEINKKGSDF